MHDRRVTVLLTLVVVAGAAGCAAPAVDSASSTAVSMPADVAAAGFNATPIAAEGVISVEEAIATASREYGQRYGEGSIDAYLVNLTDPGTLRSDTPIRDRLVWLIRYGDLSIPYTGPMTADGTPAEGGTITHAYLVIDAVTGDWLYTTETG